MPKANLPMIEIFLAAVETGTFAGAARRLGISTSGASKAVARYEEATGVRLLNRTTRRMRLTPEGTQFYNRCRGLFEELASAEAELTAQQASLVGPLRVSLPSVLAAGHVPTILADFASAQPSISLEIDFSDQYSDLVRDGIDVALRIGSLENSSLIARKICETRTILVASPEYLAEHGTPATLSDLTGHRFVGFRSKDTNRTVPFRALEDTGIEGGVTSAQISINDGIAMIEICVAKAGIIQTLDLFADAHIQAGRVVEVLPQHTTSGPALQIVYPDRHYITARQRVFVDYLFEQLKSSLATLRQIAR